MAVVSPVLVGRAAETAALRHAYERARAGRPVTVLVSGEAGIGKSRLVAEAFAGGPFVVTGACLELGAGAAPYVPFVAIVRDLVRRLGRDAVRALLPPDASALGDWLPDLGPAPARYPRTRLLEEVLALAGRVAESRPLVLVVEDLHWADASTRELFAYLARNLAGPVLLAGTVRTGGRTDRRLFAELGRRPDVVSIALGALGPADVAELLAAVDGRPADPGRSRRVHGRSGGNPLFVEALSEGEGAPADDLRELLLARVADLAEPAAELLSALAVAGGGTAEAVLATVSARPDPALRRGLRELTERLLVSARDDEYTIRHDLLREAVYAALLPSERRLRHRGFAAALARHAPADPALAAHWAAAGEPDAAVPAAWHAAARAARQHAYDEQLHLLGLVLEQWERAADPAGLIGADHGAVLELGARAAFAAGRSARGVALSTAALDALDPGVEPERVAGLLGLRGRLRQRVDGTGAEDLAAALALLPPHAPPARRARLLSALAFVGVGAHRRAESRAQAAEALRIADELDDDALRAPALLVLATLRGADGDPDGASADFATARRLARDTGDEHTFLTTFQWEALMLGAAGRYGPAAELAMAGRAAAERRGHGRSRGTMLAVAEALNRRALGEWDAAGAVLEAGLAAEPPPLYAAALRLIGADIARARGETDRFELLLRRLVEFARHARAADDIKSDIAILRLEWAAGRGELDAAEAILAEHLPAARETWLPAQALGLALAGARLQRARRAAAPRNRKVAAAVSARLAELGALAAAVPGPDAGRLTVAADDLASWDRAAAAWRALGHVHETALALTEAAGCALASNNRAGARSRLRAARDLAAGLRAAPLLERIDDLARRGRLDDLTAVPASARSAPAGFGLTARELDVLRVLARGRSNADIAAELFVSVNTVNTHVARILAKLGVATRTEAAAKAHAHGLAGLAG
ncbi:helix-turn-helix transcriptional regulator [Dactylosporangium sp. NPDC051541]|uniref:helix-turn-helix transcriptional regulator n=1 Tax=Dactylosporangium sp. NPDC051541 TaxID=3363977 RepID=UPI0037A58D3F